MSRMLPLLPACRSAGAESRLPQPDVAGVPPIRGGPRSACPDVDVSRAASGETGSQTIPLTFG